MISRHLQIGLNPHIKQYLFVRLGHVIFLCTWQYHHHHHATHMVWAFCLNFWLITAKFSGVLTSRPKGNDAHLRAIIQSEKKWKHQFFRRLRAASSVVRGRIWPNFKLIQALMYVIITCKYEKDPINKKREKVATLFLKL